MTEQQRALILLIKSALKGEPYELPETCNEEEVFRIAKEHGVDVMAYYGALRCGVDKKQSMDAGGADACL